MRALRITKRGPRAKSSSSLSFLSLHILSYPQLSAQLLFAPIVLYSIQCHKYTLPERIHLFSNLVLFSRGQKKLFALHNTGTGTVFPSRFNLVSLSPPFYPSQLPVFAPPLSISPSSPPHFFPASNPAGRFTISPLSTTGIQNNLNNTEAKRSQDKQPSLAKTWPTLR